MKRSRIHDARWTARLEMLRPPTAAMLAQATLAILAAAALTSCGDDAGDEVDGGGALDASRDAIVDAPVPFDSPPTDAPSDSGSVELDAGPAGACMVDEDCDDGRACTIERCTGGACVARGDNARCDDGIGCTTDSCTAAVGSDADGCEHYVDDAFCPEVEPGTLCDSTVGCVADPDWPCRDGDPCTLDRLTSLGECLNSPVDADSDGHAATEVEGVACSGGDDCDDTDPLVRPFALETCNARDDDCDGVVDDGIDCERCDPGASSVCMTACLSSGTRTCAADGRWGVCTVPAESCNALDDDCDGFRDEDFDCAPPGNWRSCTTTCGSTGRETCSDACAWGTCVAPDEICNTFDDDCDGTIDEGFECPRGASESCVTSCGSMGVRQCFDTCTWGACRGSGEACNGMDDDCDGLIDEAASCAAGSYCVGGTCRTPHAGCTIHTFGGHTYAVCEIDVTWDDARGRCESYGAHLVTVTSRDEQDWVQSWLATRSWLGLTRRGTCSWQWVTAETYTSGYWEVGQPSSMCGDQDCAAFWYGPLYRWDDYGCDLTAQYVCEWDA